MPTCQITVYWHEICKEGLLATGCVGCCTRGARITAGGIIAGVRWNAPGQHPLQPLALKTADQATQNKKGETESKRQDEKTYPHYNIFDSPKTTHHIAKIFSKSVLDRVSAKLSHHTWESMKGRVTSCTATKHRGYRQELPGDTTFR